MATGGEVGLLPSTEQDRSIVEYIERMKRQIAAYYAFDPGEPRALSSAEVLELVRSYHVQPR